MSKMKIILTYVDNDEKANEIAEILLKERLAACVGILPGKSRYWWKGKIEKNENELHMIIKTKESLVDEIIKKIKELHTYELPLGSSQTGNKSQPNKSPDRTGEKDQPSKSPNNLNRRF